MSNFYDRRWSIDVDDQPFIEKTDGTQFRVQFAVSRRGSDNNVYADIALYNLSVDTAYKAFRAPIPAKGDVPTKPGSKLTFRAGYVDNENVIFEGEIKNVFRERRGPDTITRLICRTGTLAPTRQIINASLGPNVSLTDVIGALGVYLVGNTKFTTTAPFDNAYFPRGYTLSGDPMDIMYRLAQAYTFSFNIIGDECWIFPHVVNENAPVHEISMLTGMEGIPEVTDIGVDVNVRLSPLIFPGHRIEIKSEYLTISIGSQTFRTAAETIGKGTYQIFDIYHFGDSWGDEWTTRIVGAQNNPYP